MINVETLVLVAVWKEPFVFQGCIKITALNEENITFFFFRCQSIHASQNDLVTGDFSADDYEFTHLYNEINPNPLHLNNENPIIAYAMEMLKYALHVTLKEMISSRKLHFTSIDDVAMQAMINKVKAVLSKKLTLPPEEHIGFAVAMDFYPQEEMGRFAALALLNKLEPLVHDSHSCH
ncbi:MULTISPECIES: hypothetical protein [Legionella]|uniref:hypothetical protein n=1 Tax=Legionella TaxID=445 RepID=UPI000F8C74F0|nr:MULTISPECIES: hypothetical protein [Legionella]MCP0912972.1 hypothetical protein [Legionella sp. 27cVA30]RUQ96882.1 hypothetical protein ELY11_07180 [Legionella septentrionalis]